MQTTSREDNGGNRANKRVEKSAEETVRTNELNDQVSLGTREQNERKKYEEYSEVRKASVNLVKGGHVASVQY